MGRFSTGMAVLVGKGRCPHCQPNGYLCPQVDSRPPVPSEVKLGECEQPKAKPAVHRAPSLPGWAEAGGKLGPQAQEPGFLTKCASC